MASNGPWDMPQPHTQPQDTRDGGASDVLSPPPTYEEATNSMPRPHAPSSPSYHTSAPTAPYPSSYSYPASTFKPSAPTTDPTTTKPPYPTEIPHPINVIHPNTPPYPTTTPVAMPMPFANMTPRPQHDPLIVPSRNSPDPELQTVTVVGQLQRTPREPGTRKGVRCMMVLVAIVIVAVVIYLLKIFIGTLI